MGNGNENQVESDLQLNYESKETSEGLLAKLLTQRIVGFLDQKPSDFAITLLPDPSLFPPETRELTNDDRLLLEALSDNDRVFLESCIVLMHDTIRCSATSPPKRVGHLGLDARCLPRMARILRKAYSSAKSKLQQTAVADTSKWLETVSLFQSTSCLLLIQPDHATAWADRRRCLLSLQCCHLKSTRPLAFYSDMDGRKEDKLGDRRSKVFSVLWNLELDFLDLLVTHHAKAPSSWAHRKYILRALQQDMKADYKRHHQWTIHTKEIMFSREVKTCVDVAEKFPKNYYAWTHRRSLWDSFAFIDLEQANSLSEKEKEARLSQLRRYIQLLETELVVGMWQEWLPNHPADHSAVHYASQVLDILLHNLIQLQKLERDRENEHEESVVSTASSALEEVRKLLEKYSCENYESLWMLRRSTCKILWKKLVVPDLQTTCNKSLYCSARTSMLVRQLIISDLRGVLKSTLSSTNKADEDSVEEGKNTNCARRESSSICATNTKCPHALSFLAWCVGNLDGICDDNENDRKERLCGIMDNKDSTIARYTSMFTPHVRQEIQNQLSSCASARVYQTSSSPILNFLT